jgi:glycosyltransferase involved in cell wall biosynthesis
MRVIFSTPNWVISGVNTFTHNLMRGLGARGHEPELLVIRKGPQRDNELPYPTDVPVNFLQYDATSTTWKDRWEALIQYLNHRAPCVYVPNYDYENSCVSPALSNEVAILGIAHGDDPRHYEHILRLGRYWNAVIAVSSYLHNELTSLDRGLGDRLFHVPYGVPHLKRLPPISTSVSGRLRIAYCGRFYEPQKRVSDLPKIAKALAQRGVRAQWTLAGAGPDESLLRDGFADFVRSGQAAFTGPLPPDSVSAIYRNHDCVILTSTHEGLPLMLLEAMGSGCVPVVTAIQSGVPDIIQHGRNGFALPVGGIEVFADHLAQLARDRELFLCLRAAAFEALAAGPYSIETVTSRYIEVMDFARDNIKSGAYRRPRTWRQESWTGDIIPAANLQIGPDDYFSLKWLSDRQGLEVLELRQQVESLLSKLALLRSDTDARNPTQKSGPDLRSESAIGGLFSIRGVLRRLRFLWE